MQQFGLPISILFPTIMGGVGYLIGKKNKSVRDSFVLLTTFLELFGFLFLFGSAFNGKIFSCEINSLMGLGLSFRLDGFRFLLTVMAMLMWAMCTLFSKQYFAHHHNRNRYYFFWLATLSSTVGVFLSGDLMTAFLFFELMSFTSYVFVAQEETKEALRAASTYLAVAVIGGLMMLMGIFLLWNCLGTLSIADLKEASLAYLRNASDTKTSTTSFYVAGSLILVGFGAKAGMFPLHIWLPKAHPVAPAPASAVLSGKLTKVGIFGILVVSCYLFFHNQTAGLLLLSIGLLTMFLGAILALFSIDLKRTLACSSVSQIGFILTGIGCIMILGEEASIAASGTILHMLNHSLFKLVLFLCAGVVFQNLHKLDLNEIRGFGRKKWFLFFAFLCGGLGISGFPGLSGYISKTLLHEGIVESIHLVSSQAVKAGIKAGEVIFLVSGGITFAYMLKLFVAIFLEKNNKEEDKMRASDRNYLDWKGRIAIGLPTLCLILFGLLPHVFYDRFASLASSFFNVSPLEEPVSFLSFENLKGGAISIVVGIVLYFTVVRGFLMKKEGEEHIYVNRWPKCLDLEELIYRPLLLKILPIMLGTIARIFGETDLLLMLLRKTIYKEKPTEQLYIGTRMTYKLGKLANWLKRVMNKSIRKNNPITTDYVVTFAEVYQLRKSRNHMIGSSLSFGLILFCVGMCVTMIYLLFL